ncbi:MAG: protein-export chaperone SecB [Alphaproteobacteria bacterium]
MSDQDQATEAATAEAGGTQFSVLAQYVKDLSFENPHAPQSLQGTDAEGNPIKPNIDVSVDIQARRGSETQYEVTLSLRVDARDSDGKALFVAELEYAGLFHITGVPDESIQLVLLVECPRLLFPFARQIVADVTRNGGFTPIMLDPMDFAGLYRARLEQAAKEQQAASIDDPAAGNA